MWHKIQYVRPSTAINGRYIVATGDLAEREGTILKRHYTHVITQHTAGDLCIRPNHSPARKNIRNHFQYFVELSSGRHMQRQRVCDVCVCARINKICLNFGVLQRWKKLWKRTRESRMIEMHHNEKAREREKEKNSEWKINTRHSGRTWVKWTVRILRVQNPARSDVRLHLWLLL